MPTPPAIEVVDLTRTYRSRAGTVTAVDGLSFTVRHGEIFAMLGPNGAGKTTTMEILEGLRDATSGVARVLGLDTGRDRAALKQRIGVQLQASSYFEHLTLAEILRLFGSFYDRARDADELLDAVGLGPKRDALVGQLSGGQAQRFSIVAALVNDPQIVFLDEPTTGLDPQARRNLWAVIRQVRDQGRTVVMTTHAMEEAEVLADRVAIVDRGRLVALDTAPALIGQLASGHQLEFSSTARVPGPELRELAGTDAVDVRDDGRLVYRLAVDDPNRALPHLFAWAQRRRVDVRDVRVSAPTLEDVFLAHTGTRLRD